MSKDFTLVLSGGMLPMRHTFEAQHLCPFLRCIAEEPVWQKAIVAVASSPAHTTVLCRCILLSVRYHYDPPASMTTLSMCVVSFVNVSFPSSYICHKCHII